MAANPQSNRIEGKQSNKGAFWAGLLVLVIGLLLLQMIFVWLFAAIALGFALSAVLLRIETWRLARVRLTKMSVAQSGLAAFRGQLVLPQTVVAPLSGKPCQFFVVTVQKNALRPRGRQVRRQTEIVAEVRSHRGYVAFSDGVDQCWLPAQLGYWNLPHQTSKKYRAQPVPEALWPYLNEEQLEMLSEPGSWDLTETCVYADDTLCAMGRFGQADINEEPVAPPAHAHTSMAAFLALARDPMRLFRRVPINDPASGPSVKPALLPHPRFVVLETPLIGTLDPDDVARSYQIAVVALWCIAGVFGALTLWLYHYL